MDQGAIQFDEAELQGGKPGEMAFINGLEQCVDSVIAMLPAQQLRVLITAVSPFGQQLLFPPAVDAVGLEIPAFGLAQTFQQGIAVALRADQIPQHEQTFNASLR